MGTEYRRGIPSVAHIEAAARLSLLWMRLRFQDYFAVVNFGISEDNGVVSRYIPLNDASAETLSEVISRHRRLGDPQIATLPFEQDASYRPIRTDGTLVDWAVLDAEVQYTNMPAAQAQPEPRRFADVRPDRHGWRWWRVVHAPAQTHLEQSRFEVRTNEFRWLNHASYTWTPWALHAWPDRTVIPIDEQGNPVSWESIAQPTATAAPTQPQGFRADLCRRMCQSFFGDQLVDTTGLRLAGITAREHDRMFRFDNNSMLVLSGMSDAGYTDADILARWANFASVLDAVAEQRVATRAGQTQSRAASQQQPSPTVSPQPRLGVDTTVSFVAANPSSTPHPTAPQPSYFTADGDTASTPAAAPPWLHQMCAEMRATASWQRVDGLQITFCLPYGRKLTQGQLDRVRRNINPPGDIDATVTRFTVAATNRPAPPVPVCIVAAMRRNQDLAVLSPDNSIPGEHDAAVAWSQLDDATSQLCRNVVHDIVEHGCYGLDDAASAERASVYHELIAEAQTLGVEVATHIRAWCSQFQTRTALLELDDVDHSQSTKLDSTPLKRGKTPTAEQIGKYREVMARRSGTAAEALKASGINSEVAQYVLDRWAGGLSDKEALWTIIVAEGSGTLASSIDRATIDERVRRARKPALDTSEPTDDTARRQREEREAQRLRMAALQAQLAAERTARTVEPQPEPNRFDLLECDPKADPAASIAAWEARQKRSTVRQMPQPQPQPLPLPAPRKLIAVVDAEAEGLRPGAVFTALLCRALNPNC